MTPEQFWSGAPRLARVYREAEVYRAKRKNLEQWLLGQYMVSALQATVGNMFQKKGAPPIKYVPEPFPLTQQEADEREVRDAEARERRLIERMEQMARSGKTSKNI